MKLQYRLLLLLSITIGSITSCKKPADKQTRFIPKDAVFVTTINTKSLQGKLKDSRAELENLVAAMAAKDDTAVDKGKKEWEDLKNSGVDFNEDIYVAVLDNGGASMMTPGATAGVTVIAALDDAAKLEAYIRKKHSAAEVKKEKDFSYSVKDENIVAWGKDVVIMMSHQSPRAGMMEYDSVNNSYYIKPGSTTTPATLVEGMTRLFNLQEKETISGIEEFAALAKSGADVTFWANATAGSASLPLPLPKVKQLLENTYTAATLNFSDGKIEVNSKSYTSKPLTDLLKKYSGQTADLSLIENYPSGNINAFAVFSVNPQLFDAIVQQVEVSAIVNNFLTNMMGSPYTLAEALKAIKGDFAFILSDVAVKKNPVVPMGMVPAQVPDARMLINIPVGNKAELDKLLSRLVGQQMLVKVNEQYRLAPALAATGYQLNIDDKNILISSDSTTLTQYKSGTGKAVLNKDVLDGFNDKSAVAYVDLQKTMSAFSAADTANSKTLQTAKSTFRDVRAYADKFSGDFMEGYYELRFMDEKKNSLTSLLNFAAVAAQNIEKKPITVPGNGMLDEDEVEPGDD